VDIMGPAYASPPRQIIGIVGDTHAFQLDSGLTRWSTHRLHRYPTT
jgi:hypothetical protein